MKRFEVFVGGSLDGRREPYEEGFPHGRLMDAESGDIYVWQGELDDDDSRVWIHSPSADPGDQILAVGPGAGRRYLTAHDIVTLAKTIERSDVDPETVVRSFIAFSGRTLKITISPGDLKQ